MIAFIPTCDDKAFFYACTSKATISKMEQVDKDINVRSNSSEKPNNCEHITEDGVNCAKYPACGDCLDNPLNKVKGSERLVKGKDEPQMGDAKPIPLSNRVTHIKDEPWTEMIKCYKCRWWNHYYGCGNPKGICEFEERHQVKRSE